ncbi:MAG TPA: TolC family protein [Nitrospirales bacterium]
MGKITQYGIAAVLAVLVLTVMPVRAEERALTLEESLRLAGERNLHIQSVKYEAAAFAEEVPKSFTEFLPKLRADARYFVSTRPEIGIPQGSIQIPAFPGVTPAFAIPTQDTNVVAGRAWDNVIRLRIDQVLFSGFRLSSQYAAANLDKQIGLSRLNRAQQEISEQVKLAYFRALKADEERLSAEARIALHQAEMRFTETMIAGGKATANAMPPLRAALAGARQESLETTQRAQVARDDLKRLVGLEPQEAIRPTAMTEERTLALDLDQAMRFAQSGRPELKELALTVDRASEGVIQAKSSLYPRVGLFGTFEKVPSEPIHPVGEVLTAGVEATWTLWEWRRSSHERAQAEFRRLQAMSAMEDRRAAIVQEVRTVYADVRSSEGLAIALREDVEAARSAAKVAEQRFRDKVGVERDVTISRIEATRAMARYRAAVYDGYLARARLERVIGMDQLPTEAASAGARAPH